jgi:Transmembrane secretion effector
MSDPDGEQIGIADAGTTVSRRSTRGVAALFAADLISTTGTEMTALALPWLVLVSTGSAARMGVVLAAEFVGITVLGLVGGRIATVLGYRGTMLVSDAARAALVVAVPVLDLLGALSLAVVVGIALLVGGFFPAYSASQRLMLAQLTGDDELRLTRASGLLNSFNESASLLGPVLGGVLLVVIGARGVLVLDAASYLCSFLLVATLPHAPRPSSQETPAAGGRQGMRLLLADPALRQQVVGVGLLQIGWTAMTATLRVIAFDSGGAAAAGLLLASYGLGSVVGGLASARARSVGGAAAGWAAAGLAATIGLLLLQPPLWGAATIVAANGVCAGLFYPRFFSALTLRTAPALRSMVLTSVTIAIAAPAPLGFLAAGVLAQRAQSPTPSLVLATAAAGLGALVVVRAQARA